jgi:hypothetical protein
VKNINSIYELKNFVFFVFITSAGWPYVKIVMDNQRLLGRTEDVIQTLEDTLLICDDGNIEVNGQPKNNIYYLTYLVDNK